MLSGYVILMRDVGLIYFYFPCTVVGAITILLSLKRIEACLGEGNRLLLTMEEGMEGRIK